MRRLLLLVPLVVMALGAAAAWWWFGRQEFTPPPPWTDEMQLVADGNNRFAFDLYAQLRQKEGNLFFSPLSAHTALAMTSTGARGKTRDEMLKVLHLPDDDRMLASGDLARFYTHPRPEFELSIANALWGQKGFPWRPEWLDMQNARFGAGFHEADFRADPDLERQRINQWVEEQTRERIKELLENGVIDGMTRMVLANAVYFKGEWENHFDPRWTHNADFTLADGTKVKTPMMHRQSGFRHYYESSETARHSAELQLAEVPYRGGELSMVIVLPGKHDGLPTLEKRINPNALAEWLKNAVEAGRLMELVLPKFRLETAVMKLKEPLQKLGMVDAFDKRADFSAMGGTPGELHISAVEHQAFVDVNEMGTEAAAATSPIAKGGEAIDFRADRPFLFLIRDVRHGTILFMGRVVNPK
jgi:serpin B